MERIDVAYVLIVDEGNEKVLAVQNEVHWSLPGGKREAGEMLAECAVREAREETGLDVALGGVVHMNEKFLDGDHVLFVTFRGFIVGGELSVGQDAEIGQVEWKSFAEAEQLMPYLGEIRGLLRCSARYVRG